MNRMRMRTKSRVPTGRLGLGDSAEATPYCGGDRVDMPAFSLHQQEPLYELASSKAPPFLLFPLRRSTVPLGASWEGMTAMRECRERR
jgi:hypothetical protein